MTELEEKILPDDFTAFIHQLESKLADLPQLEIETKHHFSTGIYAREITIPAGACVTGKTHKHEHLNIISKGTIRVATSEGIKDITAPAMIKSPPGVKRLGVAITETVWTTIHPNPENLTDLNELEHIFIVNDKIKITDNEVKECLG